MLDGVQRAECDVTRDSGESPSHAARRTHHENLQAYAGLLTQWNKKLNLVSPNTIPDLWKRHIEDSAQLAEYLDVKKPVIDIGSGAGLPGIILSILGYDVTLIESDQRKSVFLREAARVCGVAPTVLNKRVEDVRRAACEEDLPRTPHAARCTITARAFAPLPELFKMTHHLGNKYVLLKGENVRSEILEAERNWVFEHALHPSRTGNGFILIIKDLQEKL